MLIKLVRIKDLNQMVKIIFTSFIKYIFAFLIYCIRIIKSIFTKVVKFFSDLNRLVKFQVLNLTVFTLLKFEKFNTLCKPRANPPKSQKSRGKNDIYRKSKNNPCHVHALPRWTPEFLRRKGSSS